MSWNVLAFLAEPWFVIPWYVIGLLGAVWVWVDLVRVNTPLKQAMKWAWPIIVLFFSVIGLALYFGTARAPNIARMRSPKEKQRAHYAYERSMARRVNGAVIHCVAGDGLGIMSAMVIARILDLTFWQEFWFEYAVGFAFGLFIFQYRSMTSMAESRTMALAMAFRAEFFSMLTVMAGMGAVMTYVTPSVVGFQPDPLTYAFWGFGALGLLLGYVLTLPMNWMMVTIGWKHGMGSMQASQQVKTEDGRVGLFGAMAALGVIALVIPAWLTEAREDRPVATADPSPGRPWTERTAPAAKLATLEHGLRQSLDAAAQNLASGRRSTAMDALDAALRAATVGAEASPEGPFRRQLEAIRSVRHELHMGDVESARTRLVSIAAAAPGAESARQHPPPRPQRYLGVPVLNARGSMIGEIAYVDGDVLQIALGSPRDVWGWLDLGRGPFTTVAADDLVFGPRHTIGKSYVVLPTLAPAPIGPSEVYAHHG